MEQLAFALLEDGADTVLLKDETSFCKDFFGGRRHVLYIITRDSSLASMAQVRNVLKERSPKDAVLVPAFEQMRPLIETYEVPRDMLFVIVWSESLLNKFLNSTDYVIQMNRVIINGEQFGRRYPSWRTRRVSPWDVVFSWDEGILSYEQILRESIMNRHRASAVLCEYICLSVMRNVLMMDNVFLDSAETVLDEFSGRCSWMVKSLQSEIPVTFRDVVGTIDFLVQIRKNLCPIETALRKGGPH